MHSILNTLNILMGELQFLSLEIGDLKLLQPNLQAIEQILSALSDRPTILAYLQKINAIRQRVIENLKI